MKKVFSAIATVAAVIMLSRHIGNEFAAQNYSSLAIILMIGIIGQILLHFREQRVRD
ncbi:Uncharacterised protein [Niallia circulans]|jgi:hypothetical protein|uniref:hypothetical protein n=1 Tax=Niallia TaxID=2837506 RepID=UPI000ADBF43A|nr:hypothetical protein [Niallia circulans]MED3839170.1 hypothetical protein [Niallia circulans]MED4245553.1 hypothetical protein [Niallia circulans]MED4250607.1 hypothetical protein [Niallia circulans]MED5100633.1 hypothetical protein [Niallia circulans]QKH60654.1 hypothetical protein FOC77_08345 [Niallia circulans]